MRHFCKLYRTKPRLKYFQLLTCTKFCHPTYMQIPVITYVALYMLNDELHKSGEYTNRHSICVRPLGVLENRGISECNAPFSSTVIRFVISLKKFHGNRKTEDLKLFYPSMLLIPHQSENAKKKLIVCEDFLLNANVNETALSFHLKVCLIFSFLLYHRNV